MIFQKQLVQSLETNSQKTAIEFQGEKISYSALHTKANQITQFLLALELEKETVIGIDLKDKSQLISAIIGVMNARCVFVLLDRSLPAARMDHLIRDLDLQYLISGNNTHPSLATVSLVGHWQYEAIQAAAQARDDMAYPDAHADDSLYIYFTSGSTGTPKGIIGKNCSLLQFVQWETDAFDVDEDSRFSQFISPYFDAFLRDVFVPILAGGTICIPPDEEDFFTTEKITSWIDSSDITTVHCVPSLFRLFNHEALSSDYFQQLQHVLLSGEKINPSELNNWYECFQDRIQLVNLYGATESTMIRSCYKIRPEDAKKSRIPIGTPIADTELLIARKNMQPCNKLVPGDLYIISNYLTKGYLNQPHLTRERFVKLNEGTAEETVAYKTGDKARKLPNGQIELLGREDRQIKLRGIRIELDEVELILMNSGVLANAIVMLHSNEQGQESLIAFLIKKDASRDNSELQQAISNYMAAHMPAYMIPANTLLVERYPLLANGKVNFKALLTYLSPERAIVAPVNKVEEEILRIWKEILGDREISTDDSFQKAGGNSLALMGLIARVNKAFEIRISLSELFKNPTIQKQAAFIQDATKGDESAGIPQAIKTDHYPLSSPQKRVFFQYEFDRNSLAHNMPNVFKLEGELIKDQLQQVFQELVSRHETLRTSFDMVDEQPVQRIVEEVSLSVEYFSASEDEARVMIEEFIRPFDLSVAPLMRVGLIETAFNEHLLMVDFHHIISDGISQELIVKEFMSVYNGEQLAKPLLSYKDYAVWQQSETHRQSIAAQSEFWHAEFSGEVEPLELPTDFVRPPVKNTAGEVLAFEFSLEQTNQLKAMAEREGATMYMITLSVYYILLAKLSDQQDIVVGTPIAGRHQPEVENMLGMFVNVLPLRIASGANANFRQILEAVKAKTIACFDHQDYPYEELIDFLKLERDLSRNPLFDVLFSYQNYDITKLEIPELALSRWYDGQAMSKYDITLFAHEVKGRLNMAVEYATALFRPETIEKFSGYIRRIISGILSDYDLKLQDIEMMAAREKEQILVDFNDTAMNLPADKSYVDLFAQQVKNTPDRRAVCGADRQLTYRELDALSTDLATALQTQYPNAEIVGLLAGPTAEMPIGLLGILKAGKAFLPLDPEQPESRLHEILEDSECRVLVTTAALSEKLASTQSQLLVDAGKDLSRVEKVDFKVDAEALAYVIYTSGSTGKPKGVKIKHSNLLNYVQTFSDSIDLQQQDKSILTSSFVFDLGYSSIFPPLVKGAEVHLVSRSLYLSPENLLDYIAGEGISYLKITPSLLRTVVNASNFHSAQLDTVNHIVIGGEAISLEDVEKIQGTCSHIRFIDEYGPTETTVGVIAQHIDDLESLKAQPSIGKPIGNTRAFILDKRENPVPIGVAGELCLAGASVGAGYVNNPEINQQKFISSSLHPGGPLYKTGDLAKWLPDGRIVFLGRSDNQVKLRGYRIEPDEIAIQLRQHKAVENAAVVVKGEEDRQLVAYYVSKSPTDKEALKDFLLLSLPEYMVPAVFVNIEEMPLTPNGKLDVKALPEPQSQQIEEVMAPQSEEEALLVKVWSEVLKSDNISTTDNFFSVGGDSIKCILICSKMRTFGYALTIEDVLTHRSIRSISKKMTKLVAENSQEEVLGKGPLSPIQQWFFNGQIKQKHHFNQSVMLEFEQQISRETIEQVFEKIWEHHDALRTVFKKEKNQYMQQVTGKDMPLTLEVHDLREAKGATDKLLSIATDIQSGIDLAKGPLLKLGLFQMQGGDRLLIVIHHLVIDGVSWRILFEDIDRLLRQKNNNEALSLPGKTDAFQTWAKHLQAYRQTPHFEKADAYWTKALSAEHTSLPRDYPEGIHINGKSKRCSFKLDQALTSKLLSEVHGRYHTQINDILLAALVLSVQEQFGNEQVSIDLEGHGRENIHQGENVSRTVGWFTSIYPVLLSWGGADLSDTVKVVKEVLRRVPNNGIDYLLREYSLDENGSKNKRKDSQIIFNYLGQFDSDIDDKSFKVTQKATGLNRAEGEIENYDWELSGMISGGELSMDLMYSDKQYHDHTLASFMKLYKKHLVALIDHCSTYDKEEFTPSDFTYKDLSLPQVDELNQAYEMSDLYPLSPMQEGMLFHALLDADSEYYFEQMTCSIKGNLDVANIEQSMNVLMARYDILRTVFLHEGYERPIQLVLKERKVDFQFIDARDECLHRLKTEVVHDYKVRQRAKKFDLSSDVLVRMLVLQTAEDGYELIWAYHHILMDGWCMGIITSELKRVYSASKKGVNLALPHSEPFSRYIQWIENRNKHEALDYWKGYLEGYDSVVSLPEIDVPLATDQPNDLKFGEFTLNEELTASVNRISGEHGVTVNTIIQCAWGVLLGRYNNLDDVVFGSVVSGRPAEMEGMENMIGLFINTVPVRIRLEPEAEVTELLQQTQRSALAGDQYHYNPLSDIQVMSPLGSDLINCVLVFENYPVADQITDTSSGTEAIEDFVITDVDVYEPTNYDLIVFVVPGDEIFIRFDYNAHTYAPETIEGCLVHLKNIITEMATNTRVKLKDIPLLTEQEQQYLVYELNQTTVPAPVGCETVLDLFRRQAEKTPDHIALRYGEEIVTYRELDEQTDQMAAYLAAHEAIQQGDLVALVMDRHLRLIMAMVGVMKSGAAYLPIEPAYPAERKELLINSSQSSLVILDSKNQDSLPPVKPKLLNLEEAISGIQEQPAVPPSVQVGADQMAYVIYTSGSTGQPKGVMIDHSAMLNFVNWSAREYSQGQESASSFALNSSIAFDLTVTVIYSPLVTGNELVIYHGEDKTAQILEVLEDGQANIIKLTPTHLKLIRDSDFTAADLKNLNTLIVGGEELTYKLAKEVYDQLGGAVRMYNEYGPTEATVTCMNLPIDPEIVRSVIPIGLPIDNTQTYVLDPYLKPVPVGVEGELYIAGDGLAMGYLYAEALTHEKFIDNPFIPGKKMYQTGDLAKVNRDGHIVFAGRIDDQVKIRGFRIELGEIESHLVSHEKLSEVVVAIKEKSGDQYLVAYYQSDVEIEASTLVAHLQPKLPNHMIPSFFVCLDDFPVTNSGKLNRKALPDPELDSGNNFEAPATDVEKRLVEMWAEVLKLDTEIISVTRSFFELGGHSLKSISLVNKITREFGIKLSLNDVFVYQTVRKLSTIIDQSIKSTYMAVPKAAARLGYPLSQAQMPLYFQHELDPDSLIRNLSYIVEIEGKLDKAQLDGAFRKLIDRHESLRTAFHMSDEGPEQLVSEQIEFAVSHLTAGNKEVHDMLDEFVRPFDITQAPLMRVGLIESGPLSYTLIVDVHHLIADGLSIEILKREFLALYNGLDLPALEIQYTDYVMWEAGEGYQTRLHQQKQFWLDEFSQEIQPLEVPLDYERPEAADHEGARTGFRIGADKSQQLRALAESQGATTAMMVLSVFNILLSKLARQEDIIIGMPLSGREQTELEGVTGMFARVLPVRSQLQGQQSFVEYLSQVKHKFSNALDHQGYPYEDLARELGIQRNSGRNPWFDVMLEYQHYEAVEELENSGLNITEYADKTLLTEKNLGLDVLEQKEEIFFGLSYSKALFRSGTIDKFIQYFKQITDAVLENPDGLISQIDIVEGEERRKLLFEFNGPVRTFDRNKTYSTIFKEQVVQSPDSVAVEHNGTRLTYQQLYEKSIDMAAYLQGRGVDDETKVGIYLPRSIDMLVSILGTLQVGSAYVPIDIFYPEKRIVEIVKDSEISIIITNSEHKADLDKVFESTSTLETVFDINQLPLTKRTNGSAPSFSGNTNDLAYMIFTSGTTGKPKGVMIHQLGMINHLYAKINDLSIGASDVIAQTASPCFDISVWQFLAALMVGGKTYIIDKEKVVYPDSLCKELEEGKVSIFESVPSLMTSFLDDLPDDHDLSLKQLRWMVPTGEALSVALAKKWYQYFPDIKLLNAYGPTEASDDITHYVVEPDSLSAHVMPIGQPLANTHIFILNEYLGLCPVGVRGEICVAGLGVGKGYWRNEEKTNEVFVPNPLLAELDDPDYATLYKTGDIGYFREDGNIIYVGRKDDQLKINGNRVELGEIESRLSLHEAVKEAAVVAKGEGTKKFLVAYYVSQQSIDQNDLKVHLVDQLPDYMVPAVYMELDVMPLTANGKLNRQALPDPDFKMDDDYTRPATVTEIKLCEIWSQVLKIDRDQVSVTADFFSLGGNSLMSITLIGKIHKEMNVKLSLRDFFSDPTVRSTAEYIDTVSWLSDDASSDGKKKIEITI